jgi:hypothetical protein
MAASDIDSEEAVDQEAAQPETEPEPPQRWVNTDPIIQQPAQPSAARQDDWENTDPIVDEAGVIQQPIVAQAPPGVQAQAPMRAYPKGVTPRAKPAAQGGTGLYEDEHPDDFAEGTATMFGDQGDIDRYHAAKAQGASDSEAFQVGDNGIGAGAVGGLETSGLYGIAVPQSLLRSRYGNNYPAWRSARVDVVDPSSGRRLRLPIVDVGPSESQQAKGIIADFTPGVDQYFNNQGGGKRYLMKIVDNAGPDVHRYPGDFNNEQAALAEGFDSSQLDKRAQRFAKPGQGIPTARAVQPELGDDPILSDAEVIERRQEYNQKRAVELPGEMAALQNLQQQNPNPTAMVRALDKTIPGVSDQTRSNYAANYKAQVTKDAQQFFNEPDPDKAFAKATGGAGPVEFAEQFGRQFFAKAGNLDVGMNKFFANADDALVNNFVNTLATVHPESIGTVTPEGKAAFTKYLFSLPPTDRAQTIGKLVSDMPPAIQGSMNTVSIADAADRLADPKYQAEQAKAIQTKQEFLDKTAKSDPNFTGTPAEWWTDHLATLGVNALTAFIPPPIRNTLWFAQFASDAKEKLKAEHPDWSQDEVNTRSAASSVVQLASQELLMHLIGGKFAGLTEGIVNPFVRAGARALTETALGAGGAGVAQVGANIAERAPITQGVPQAMMEGAFQAGVPAVVHGAGELAPPQPTTGPTGARIRGPTERTLAEGAQPPPVPPPEPVVPPVAAPERAQPPPVPPPVPPPEPVTPPVAAPERPVEPGAPAVPPVKPEVPLSTEAPKPPPAFEPEAHSGNMGPLGYRAAVRLTNGEVFSGIDHARALDNAFENGSIRVTDATTNYGFIDKKSGQFISMEEADRILGEHLRRVEPERVIPPPEPVIPREEPLPPSPEEVQTAKAADEPEPWTSAIANKYIKERAAKGELEEIAPGQGYKTEDLVQRGLQMGPEEITQHISDVMNNRHGDPVMQMAAARAEEARLSQQAARLSERAEANPGNAQAQIDARNARDNLTDLHVGALAKLKKMFHGLGMASQGELPIDLSTFNGIREQFLRDIGKAPPVDAEPAMRRTAAKVKAVVDADALAREKAKVIDRHSEEGLPSEDDVHRIIMETMGQIPCVRI